MSDPAKRPRIRHLTTVHRVEDTRILRRECASLVRAGHDVALIAGRPPQEPVDGVRVVGVGLPSGRIDRATRVAWRVLGAARRERADIAHFHDPELIWVGLVLKLLGCRVVYDVHEDVPLQVMNKWWIPRWARWFLARGAAVAEQVAGRAVDAIVTATRSIAEKFPSGKTVVVQNFPPVALAQRAEPIPVEERRYEFAYVGGLKAVQGARELPAVAAALPNGSRAVIAGWFDDDAVERDARASAGWQRIDYLGGVSHEEVIDAIRDAVCGIVIDHPISNYLDSYSTKMFEYMACGVPVVCSDFPLWVRLVGGADCGITLDPLDPLAAGAAIEKLLKDPDEARRLGANGRRAILERYNWEAEFAKLDALYPRLG